MTVTERLFALQDTKYRDFSARLMPNISKDAVIGVRAPAIRALAKELYGTDEAARFMAELPHKYFDENNLHGAASGTMLRQWPKPSASCRISTTGRCATC